MLLGGRVGKHESSAAWLLNEAIAGPTPRTDVERRFRCWVVYWFHSDAARWKFRRWQSGRFAAAVAESDVKLRRAFVERALPFRTPSLCEREWDQGDGQK